MGQIFAIIIEVFFGLVALSIAVQCAADLKEQREEVLEDIRSFIRGTKLHMFIKNKMNKVEVLTDDQYEVLRTSGKIRTNIYLDK